MICPTLRLFGSKEGLMRKMASTVVPRALASWKRVSPGLIIVVGGTSGTGSWQGHRPIGSRHANQLPYLQAVGVDPWVVPLQLRHSGASPLGN